MSRTWRCARGASPIAKACRSRETASSSSRACSRSSASSWRGPARRASRAALERAVRWGTADKPLYRAHLALARLAAVADEVDLPLTEVLRAEQDAMPLGRFLTVEEIAGMMTPAPWLQLYLLKDRSLSWDMLDRAWASGVRVLEFSVDTAVAGRRTRDLRHGLTIPPSLGAKALAGIAARPRYWTSMLQAPALEFANLRSSEGQSIREINSQFETALTWADLSDLRGRWPGQLVVKGDRKSTRLNSSH